MRPEAQELLLAVQSGALERVEQLLDAHPELVNAMAGHQVPFVLMALYYSRPEIAEVFAQRGAVLDVFSAAALGKVDRLKQILKEDPSQVNVVAGDGFHPLGLAAFFGQAEAVKVLINECAWINTPSQNPMQVTALHSAVAGQYMEVACALLEEGADPNVRQGDGSTPLMAAAQNGQPELIRLLLQYQADPSLALPNGVTALQLAEQSGNAEAVALLRM